MKLECGHWWVLVLAICVSVGLYVSLKISQREGARQAGEAFDRVQPEAEIKSETQVTIDPPDLIKKHFTPEYLHRFELAADVFRVADAEWWARYEKLADDAKTRAAKERAARVKQVADGVSDSIQRVNVENLELRKIVVEMK